MIETLIQRNEYIDANERRHNSFSIALNKFAKFADLAIDGLKSQSDRKSVKSVDSSLPNIIKTVDLDNPQDCTFNKPCSLIFNELKYSVKNWYELYTKFLKLLYNDNAYTEIMKGMIGKSLYGRKSDFEKRSYYLRKSIRVSANFYAEGNLSAADIIKHIKLIMELCSISRNQIAIEYNTHGRNDENFTDSDTVNDEPDDYKQLLVTDEVPENVEPDINETLSEPQSVCDVSSSDISFTLDTTMPFVLKDAIIEILSSNAPEISQQREHKNGMSTKALSELIKKYYEKTIGIFEISKLLMMDKTFQSVGKGCYILNETMISHKIEAEYSEPVSQKIEKEEPIYEEQIVDITETVSENELTIESILDVIKQNADNLQYEDGFSAYDVKPLLKNQGIFNVAENDIEVLMSECPELKEIEDGYYVLADAEDSSIPPESEIPAVIEEQTEDEVAGEVIIKDTSPVETVSETRHIVLSINGDTVRAYDYSDALNKICEFAINCKPFRMARIAGQGIKLNGNNVFYRKAIPVDRCDKLSNGLQVIMIDNISDLQIIAMQVKEYCQIDDDMIVIFSK